jgi:hypothetical protein
MELLGIISVDFDVTDQPLIIYLALSDAGEKWEDYGKIHKLLKTSIKSMILLEEKFCTMFSLCLVYPQNWFIKMCLNLFKCF